MKFEKTRALIGQLAKVIGAEIPQDVNGGFRLSVESSDVFIYPGDDVQILMVVPVDRLPEKTDYALTSWLLRSNLFDSEWAPFQIAIDEAGTIVLWGKLRISELDGEMLAKIIEAISDRAVEIRKELDGYSAVDGRDG